MNALCFAVLALVYSTVAAPAQLAALLSTAAISAERAPFSQDLAKLKQEQQKAVAAALEPVNRRYQASLEALLRRAMEGKDLHTANLINAELKKLGVPNAKAAKTPVTAENFEKRLIGTQWSYFGNETITFLEGSKAQWKDSPALWTWSVQNAGARVIEGVNANRNTRWTITFDRNLETGRLEGDGKRTVHRLK